LRKFDYLKAQRGSNAKEINGTCSGCELTQQLQDVPLGGKNVFSHTKNQQIFELLFQKYFNFNPRLHGRILKSS
jgi:hypothetical protein